MKIAIRRGHQRTGQDIGAEALLKEIDVADYYYKEVIELLKKLGHEVLDVTPPEANRTVSNSLMYGIDKSNKWGAELFISCHANKAYDKYEGKLGCEVIYYPSSRKGRDYAVKVEKELSKLGFKSRGAKEDRRGLAELRLTNMPAIIIEPFFIEATEDVNLYKKIGAKAIAKAIVTGILR